MNENQRNAWLTALRREARPPLQLRPDEPAPSPDLDELVDEALQLNGDPDAAVRTVAGELAALGVSDQLRALQLALPAYVAARSAERSTA